MTAAERFGICQILRAAVEDGNLPHGAMREIADWFDVSKKTVS
jgi:hypothetical protein